MPVETELYEILEIHVSASQEEIKKAYRKKALQHHPDKGGDPEMFKKVNTANEILSNPEKRNIYDKHGKDGLQNSGGIPTDIFSAMFGNVFGNVFGNMNRNRTNIKFTDRKTAPVSHTHSVSLEDLCKRKIIKLRVERERLCSCINESNTQSCSQCSGNGVRTEIRSMGFIQQHIQQVCNSCEGSGKMYSTCGQCKNGAIIEPKVFELFLNPELDDGFRYIFADEGNQAKGYQAGDFIVVLQYLKHPAFLLDGKKMTYNHTITLKEALCGHTLYLTHPDGQLITVQTEEVINPTTVKVIEKRGLTEEANLEIKYSIIFPISLTDKQREDISKNLG